jgi:two-component system cell cycle sensor histidine kinase/response regulator CckA
MTGARDGMTEAGYLLELMDRSPVLCFVKDREGKYLYVNRAWLELSRRSREEVLGHTDHEVFSRASADEFVENDRQVFATGRSLEVEEHLLLNDRECIGHSMKFALRDGQGRVSGIAGLVIDVTERHEARRALAQSEERYRELLDHSPEAYVVLDLESKCFVDANDNACRLFKLPREQLLRMGPVDLSPPSQADGQASAQRARTLLDQVVAGSSPVFDWLHQAGDGELLPCRIWLSRVSHHGRTAVRASILDMRETERVRTALARTRAQLEAVQDALPQLVVVFEPGGQVLVHCNRRYRELVGTPPAPQLWQLAHEACERAMRGETGRQEVKLSTVAGRKRTIEVEVSVFHRDEAGNPALLLLVGSDVTEQREIEAQLLQSRKLESLGRLAGGVAHDFNNLLTVILGSTDFLRPALEGDESALADLASLAAAAEKARTLTQQLLTFARVESGCVEAVVVDQALGQSLAMLERLLGEDVAVETTLQASDAVVMIDRGKLDQIVVNLAVNARDAMSRGGKLHISTRRFTLAAEPAALHALGPGPYVELSFEDTGDGMSADVSERAFEPFFTTKPKGKGTGLGLSTVHGIVAAAQGRVLLDSRLGQGTRVTVLLPVATLPANAAAATATTATDQELRCQRRRRLLLIEDHEAVRAVNARALRAAGHVVVEAEGPRQALDIAERGEKFDLLVSDVVMPEMSGLELAQRLMRVLGNVDVLFVSGYAEDVLAERGMSVADVNLLRKPFSAATLVRRVDETTAASTNSR